MPPPPDPQTSLLSRSPRSRKSLAPASIKPGPLPTAKRKRAHSIAPGENPKLDGSRRRSLMRPTKGILKPSNQADDTTQDVSEVFHPSLEDSKTNTSLPLSIGEFQTNVHDNHSRKSLGGRRVSFAAHAHVRVFESAEQDVNGVLSPASSGPSDPVSPSPSPSPSPQPSPDASAPSIADPPSPHGRSHPSMHPDENEGEESMDVSDDGILPPSLPPLAPSLPPPPPLATHHADSDNSEDEEGDMSMTGNFGLGIVARRRTMSMAGPRKSRLRSSIAVPPTETGEEAMEFTVALDRPPPPESDAFKALRAMANDSNATDDGGEVDMDVTTAVTRLMHVRNSMGAPGSAHEDSSFSSTEDSLDGVDAGDRTVNVTNLMNSFHVGGDETEGDMTMSAASVVLAPITTRPASPPPPPSKLPVSPAKSTTSRVSSPTKPPPKQFTAAFAPPHQPSKRPAPVGFGQASPNKRRAAATSEVSTQRIPVPTTAQSESPQKGPQSSSRRPSGYYRKSLGSRADAKSLPRPFVPLRRQSMAAGSPGKKAAKSLPFAPRAPTVHAVAPAVTEPAEEEHREPSPVRELSVPASAREEQHAPKLLTPNDAVEGLVKDVHKASLANDASPLSPRGMDPSEWVSTVRGEDVPQEDDLAPISVDKFFAMTGIRFMDDLTCPRRSTVHPSQLQRRDSNEGEEVSYPLSDYAVAMAVDIAQLETMTWIANDILSAIEKYKVQYRQTEDDAAKDIPVLFREFATAPESRREQFVYVLKLIKAHTIGSAKASWYEWKRGWVQGLQANAERTLHNLDADKRQLEDIAAQAGDILPSLRAEYDQIMQELETEQAAVAEIENCDQVFLSELKATIAEQRQELDVFQNDIQDGKSKLSRLEETLEDLEDQARDAKTAISTAQRQMDMQKSSTRAEVFRLQDELRSLQDLHLWRATALSPDLIEFVYDSKYTVVIPCRRFTPVPDALRVLPFGEHARAEDDFPLVTEVMYRTARRHAIQDHDDKLTLRMIIQRLTDFWASYAQLRWQLSFIVIKYPLSLQLTPEGAGVDEAQGFKATATLLLSQRTSKAHISFHIDSQILCNWPMAAQMLQYDVAVAYGNADPRILNEAVKRRLSQVRVDENHACLVDACMEVVSQCS